MFDIFRKPVSSRKFSLGPLLSFLHYKNYKLYPHNFSGGKKKKSPTKDDI